MKEKEKLCHMAHFKASRFILRSDKDFETRIYDFSRDDGIDLRRIQTHLVHCPTI